MAVEATRLGQSQLRNAMQTALIVGGLAMLVAVPAWLLAGIGGLFWATGLVLILALAGARVPARYVLARSGAVFLQRSDAPGLYSLLDELYRRAGLRVSPQLFWVPAASLNAFAVGDRRDGGLAVSHGLIKVLDARQLAAVLAHEVSHLRNGDTYVMSMASMVTELTAWGALFVQLALLLMLPFVLAGEMDLPWIALLVAACAPTASSLLQLALSRNREYAADLDAVAITGDPRGLASALGVLDRYNGSWLAGIFGHRTGLPLGWLRTHPPTARRIERLLELEPPPPSSLSWPRGPLAPGRSIRSPRGRRFLDLR